jgi:hypothetical protein
MLIATQKSFAHSRAATQKSVTGLAPEDEPEELGVEEKNNRGDAPGDNLRHARVHEATHFCAVSSELNQGNDSKGQLKT